ncbi:PAS-domain containing protein [Cognatishimia sp. WU-CL00825]|uniref:PAS-domain containing protein n=1 Tax=Cognatishimia sp. WU-CL00825 TaxID=3127658 RepID=UPI0031086B9C
MLGIQAVPLGWIALSVIGATLAGYFIARGPRLVLPGIFKQKIPAPCPRLVFLFERGCLADASPAALQLMGQKKLQHLSWDDINTLIAERVRDLPAVLGAVGQSVQIFPKTARYGEAQVSLEQWHETTRVELHNWPETHNLRQLTVISNSELATLRHVAHQNPVLCWRTDQSGQVLWQNDKCHELCKKHQNSLLLGMNALLDLAAEQSGSKTRRAAISNEETEATLHFDINQHDLGDGFLYFAQDVTAIVNADRARQDFIQTLGKTFAQISTGLVIFDKDRRLVQINPALMDMLKLAPDFLSRKHTLQSFFDYLRETRMIPEPRSYATWRKKLTNLILEASHGTFTENWQLPSGATYKVSGRPHPEGAIAFLFEDISVQLSLTRRINTEIEHSQAILDCLEQAVVAVNSSGQITFTNQAFRTLWCVDPDSSFATFSMRDLTALWKTEFSDKNLAKLSEFVAANGRRQNWNFASGSKAQRRLRVYVSALPSQETLIRFKLADVTPSMSAAKTPA